MQGFDSATRLRYTCTYGTYAESCGLERVPALEEKFINLFDRTCQDDQDVPIQRKYPKTIQNHPKPF